MKVDVLIWPFVYESLCSRKSIVPIHASAVFVDCGTFIVVRIHDYLSVFDSHM